MPNPINPAQTQIPKEILTQDFTHSNSKTCPGEPSAEEVTIAGLSGVMSRAWPMANEVLAIHHCEDEADYNRAWDKCAEAAEKLYCSKALKGLSISEVFTTVCMLLDSATADVVDGLGQDVDGELTENENSICITDSIQRARIGLRGVVEGMLQAKCGEDEDYDDAFERCHQKAHDFLDIEGDGQNMFELAMTSAIVVDCVLGAIVEKVGIDGGSENSHELNS